MDGPFILRIKSSATGPFGAVGLDSCRLGVGGRGVGAGGRGH